MELNFADPKEVETLVKRRHPEFADLIDHWKFCGLCYDGGRKWICEENVFRFYKEGEVEYKSRLSRTYRANHTKRVVDTVNEYLFKQKPTRDSATPDLIERFWKNCDRKGSQMDDFVRNLEKMESVYGRLYIVVDRPADVAANASQEKLPYVYIVKPTHMMDMGFDEEGNLTWALIAEDYRDDKDPKSSGQTIVRFRLWTRREWYLFVPEDASAEEVKYKWAGADDGFGEHGLDAVPVIPHGAGTGSLYSSPAMISDIVYMDRTLVNYGALLDETIYEQTFSQLIMPAEAILPGTKESGQLIAASKERIFIYNGNSTHQPSFISPDVRQPQLLVDAMDKLARNIYAITGTDHEGSSQSMSTGKSYSSGTVRAFDHAQIENMLLGKARALELTEDRIMNLAFNWMGEKGEEINKDWVRYPHTFDIRGLVADLAISAELYKVTAPETVMREHMKVTADKLFPRKSPEEMKEIYAAIDEWKPMFVADNTLAERQVAVAEDKNEVARESLEQSAELERERIESQEKTAAAAAKIAAKKPAPAAKKAA